MALARLNAAGLAVVRRAGADVPKRAAVLRYMRNELDEHGRYEPDYALVRAGEPVPAALLTAFVCCWNRDGRREPLEPAHVEELPSAPPGPREYLKNAWQAVASQAGPLELPPAAYATSRADVEQAADAVAHCVGRHLGPRGADPWPVAERAMRVSRAGYRECLVRIWERVQESVVFVTGRRAGRTERLGVVVLVPLTVGAYGQIRRGQTWVPDLPPEAIATGSNRLFIEAVAEFDGYGGASPSAFVVQAIHTLLYQAAVQTPDTSDPDWAPSILAFTGTPKSAERARWFGLQPIGTGYGPTGLPLIELAPPGRDGNRLRLERALKYYTMTALVRAYKDHQHIDAESD